MDPTPRRGSRSSRRLDRLVSEEPVFDTGLSSSYTPAEEFTLDQSIILPDVEEFLAKKQIDPWHRMSALEHDCILVVEFSELEGPKPSFCIPESPGAHFERNDFSVWLMTADYQASNRRGGPFFINEDIQMLLSNEEQGVHTYAHHFTLFDIEARGYVRPFCATYVTPDGEKLTRLFDTLRQEFSSVLRNIKTCNRRLFRKALTEAVEALNVIETQAISGYYELCFDGKLESANNSESGTPVKAPTPHSSPTHISRQEKADVLNLRYRRLQRELMLAQNVVADDLKFRQYRDQEVEVIPSTSTNGCGSHEVNMDQWINSMRRGEGMENHKKTLKELQELCPCVFEEFQRQMRSIWMKFRHWNKSAASIFEPTRSNGVKLNVGSIPILYLPVSANSDREDSGEEESRAKENGHNILNGRIRGISDFSITEVDALYFLVYSKNYRRNNSKDSIDQQLLINVAPHLRYFLYPILTGQLLITYGSDLRRQLITDLMQKLKLFIPTIFASPRCSLWNENPISESVLGDYKILGLRISQKENISDYVKEDIKKYVALLDLNNDIFHVADYKGEILTKFMTRLTAHKSDWTLIMAILCTISEYANLAYLYSYSANIPKTTSQNGFLKWNGKRKDTATILKLEKGDLRIVKYFVELLRMQKGEEERDEDGFLLDYEPARLHKM